jgi:hypothetical protein
MPPFQDLEPEEKMKKCNKCLDFPDEHRCFRCGVSYCGCDQGSYYNTIGPSEYTCTPCYENHRKKYKSSILYHICHDFPLYIGGIVMILIFGFILMYSIKFIFETYTLSKILFYSFIINMLVIIIVKFITKYNKESHRQHKEFMKQRKNESDAQYRFRINWARWNSEMLHSGL